MVGLAGRVGFGALDPQNVPREWHADTARHGAELGLGARCDAHAVDHSEFLVVGDGTPLGIGGSRAPASAGRTSSGPPFLAGGARWVGAHVGSRIGGLVPRFGGSVVRVAHTQGFRSVDVGLGDGHALVDSRRRHMVGNRVCGHGCHAMVRMCGESQPNGLGIGADGCGRLGLAPAVFDSGNGATARGSQVDPVAGSVDRRHRGGRHGGGPRPLQRTSVALDWICLRCYVDFGVVFSAGLEGHQNHALACLGIVECGHLGSRDSGIVTFWDVWA